MEKQKYKCRTCGAILIGDAERRKHCQTHHPSTPFNRLDVYFPMEYTKINDGNATPINVNVQPNKTYIKPKTTIKYRSDRQGNVSDVSKKELNSFSSFDCSKAIPINVLRQPKSSSVDDLFEFAVKRVAKNHMGKPSLLDANTTAQWSNICFNYPGTKFNERQDYMMRIKNKFSAYFKRRGFKCSFDFEQIVRDFPQFFQGGESRTPIKEINLDALIGAVQTEKYLSQQPKNRLTYKVERIEKLDGAKHLYQFYLDLGDDDIASFYDGMAIKLKIGNSYMGNSYYECEGIDYDMAEEILTIRSERTIIGRYGTIYLDTTFILEALCNKLIDLKNQGFLMGQPGRKFLPDNTRNLSTVQDEVEIYSPIVKNLDSFQIKAHNESIKKDISFIWGPPGTGKSYTLAALINSLFRNDSSTLVCCISNVAVDQLLNKVIDVVINLNLRLRPGQFLRSGHTIDSRLLQLDYLFPSDFETKRIRKRITELTQKIASPGYDTKTKALFKEQRIDLRDALKNRVETLIGGSKIVFSTISNYILSKPLIDKKFDNLIVDEASMISLPYLMAIASKIAKRIILVGDPNQLGPISINPDRLLRDSIFDYCKVFNSEADHPALHQLLTQRRSHSSIVNLTNNVFYNGRLKPVIQNSPDWVINGPIGGKIVKIINKGIENNEVKLWGTSRRNYGTHYVFMELLEEYHKYWRKTNENISIGIITPYRAQVRLYYDKVRKAYSNSKFFKNIRIGTIHTFQGSECDIIFFDLVEESPTAVSRLLNDKEGERLITVALTRARHKLIVAGDTRRFEYSTGIASVSDKVCQVLRSLSDKQVLLE